MIEKSVSNENLASFPNLENFITKNELTVSEIVINNIKNHSQMIVEIFEEYFSEFNWIRNPFVTDLDSVRENLSVNEKESLIELSCDGALQVEFNKEELCEFWLKVKNGYPSLSRKALLFLIPFTTTYLCESGFSAMLIIKNKYRNKLNIDTNLRLKLSTTEPDISSLVSNMQHHFSH
ncbi:zinc finger BED domain-containing protein 5-like [Diabrotica undecimpunctata]|uniref:zinc finger BED domain-containing protein 5-like n=1 Tax=Diabrotica undecimpunctata TaxID=50387 RepID=UPI003B639F7F